ALGGANGIVFHQHHALDVLLREREHELADALRRERIGGDAAGWRIHGPPGLQCVTECGREPWLDADQAEALLIPRSDAADQSATADGNQQRVELRCLLLELESDGPLPQQRRLLVEGMDLQRAAL